MPKSQEKQGKSPAPFSSISILKFDTMTQGEDMAHRKMVYRYGPGGDKYTEYEFKFVGRFGAKGEKRGPRKRATPEQIRKQNHR